MSPHGTFLGFTDSRSAFNFPSAGLSVESCGVSESATQPAKPCIRTRAPRVVDRGVGIDLPREPTGLVHTLLCVFVHTRSAGLPRLHISNRSLELDPCFAFDACNRLACPKKYHKHLPPLLLLVRTHAISVLHIIIFRPTFQHVCHRPGITTVAPSMGRVYRGKCSKLRGCRCGH
jgi:hypothetical protein